MPLIDAFPPPAMPAIHMAVRPSGEAQAPPLLARASLPVPDGGVVLSALTKKGELAYLSPDGGPRLLPLAPIRAAAPVIVFIHGIGGDPANQTILIEEAQRRGLQVYVMAYDTYNTGGSNNSQAFATEFLRLAATRTRDVTVVAHSLGALTFKATLNRLTRADGHLDGFSSLRYFALSAPWAGVKVADLALAIGTGHAGLAYARDLAPGSDYWTTLINTPFAPEVTFYNVGGAWDQFNTLAWGPTRDQHKQTMLSQARRAISLPRGTHHTAMWDPRAAAFIFDPDNAPAPETQPDVPLWKNLWLELMAVSGMSRAFLPPSSTI